MSDLIRQGEHPHALLRLGDSQRTVAQAGCLLCCLTQAANILHPEQALTVSAALERVASAGSFFRGVDGKRTASLVVPVAARALGMVVVDRASTLKDLDGWLAKGKPAIIGVDYKEGRSSGLSTADHFVMAVRLREQRLTVMDPAFGRLLVLDVNRVSYKGQDASLTEAIYLDSLPA